MNRNNPNASQEVWLLSGTFQMYLRKSGNDPEHSQELHRISGRDFFDFEGLSGTSKYPDTKNRTPTGCWNPVDVMQFKDQTPTGC